MLSESITAATFAPLVEEIGLLAVVMIGVALSVIAVTAGYSFIVRKTKGAARG